MRERAELLGGTVTAGPTVTGFRVELWVPSDPEGFGEPEGVPRPIRVLVADDQRVVREGLVLLLGLLPGIEVVGAAADGEQAVALAARLHPDVVLMDLRMPRLDGVAAIGRLGEHDPRVKVIALTIYADERSVVEALRAGARGYLTKDAGAEEIRQAVARGEGAIDPAVQRHLLFAKTGVRDRAQAVAYADRNRLAAPATAEEPSPRRPGR